MKITRKQARNVKIGDLVQGNVVSIKDLDATWYEVKSVVTEGRDTTLVVQRCTMPGGVISRKGEAFTEKFNPRTTFAVMV